MASWTLLLFSSEHNSCAIMPMSPSTPLTRQISAFGLMGLALSPMSRMCHMFQRAMAPESMMFVITSAPQELGNQSSGRPKQTPHSREYNWRGLSGGPFSPPGKELLSPNLMRSSTVASNAKPIRLCLSGATLLMPRCSCCSPCSIL